jgi:hypothetical protein
MRPIGYRSMDRWARAHFINYFLRFSSDDFIDLAAKDGSTERPQGVAGFSRSSSSWTCSTAVLFVASKVQTAVYLT